MRLSTTVFSKPCAPCCFARKISAVPPSAILRRIVYRELGLIGANSGSPKLPCSHPLMTADSLATFSRRQKVEDASRKVERGEAATAKTILLVEDDYDVRDTLQ